jgi:hypothetical protein
VIRNYRGRRGLAKRRGETRRSGKTARASPGDHRAHDRLRRQRHWRAHQDAAAYAKKFSGKYAHRLIKGGIGHNLPQEVLRDFAEAVVNIAES